MEAHELGPRCYVFGLRVHECHLGLALLPVAALLWDVAGWGAGAVALILAAWLVVKDWRDLFPATRDTAAWSIGPHTRNAMARPQASSSCSNRVRPAR